MEQPTQSYGVQEAEKSRHARLPTMRIMWGAFLAAQLVLAFIGYFTTQDLGGAAEPPWVVVGVLGAAAMANVVGLFVVVPRMFKTDTAAGAMSFFIVRIALAETASIFGVVTLFLGAPWWIPIPFFVLGMGSIASLYPRG